MSEGHHHQQQQQQQESVLLALGFCGVDESIPPRLLGVICHSYPIVEFGVLLRPDKMGEARYPTFDWIAQLGHIANTIANMKLAAHLCGSYVNELLYVNDSTIITDLFHKLRLWNFRRIQINATAVNGVDTSHFEDGISNLIHVIESYTNQFEFIIQKNDETKVLSDGLLQYYHSHDNNNRSWPANVSMLVDESKGTGILPSSWQPQQEGESNAKEQPSSTMKIGYAGGLGPHNIRQVFPEIIKVSQGQSFWIDMESSLRTIIRNKDGTQKDIFDIHKCYEVIQVITELGYMKHPSYMG